jgi:hypothetical protein
MEQLLKIQAELKAPKNQRNKFGNYNYRSAEDILEAVKPLLFKYKCLLYIADEIECINGRNYVKSTAFFTELETGKQIQVPASAREEETKKGMDGSQITGASSSYARKYALNGLFLIDDTKDSDFTNQHDKSSLPMFDRTMEGYSKWVEWFARSGGDDTVKFSEIEKKFNIDYSEKEELKKQAALFNATLKSK